MLLVLVFLLPALRSVPGSSIYAFTEQRFGAGTRQALAASFLLSRGLALGVINYASALVLSEALGWPLVGSILAVGLFSVAYTSLGGLVADIWSDVLQFVLGGGLQLQHDGRAAAPPACVPRRGRRLSTAALDS